MYPVILALMWDQTQNRQGETDFPGEQNQRRRVPAPLDWFLRRLQGLSDGSKATSRFSREKMADSNLLLLRGGGGTTLQIWWEVSSAIRYDDGTLASGKPLPRRSEERKTRHRLVKRMESSHDEHGFGFT